MKRRAMVLAMLVASSVWAPTLNREAYAFPETTAQAQSTAQVQSTTQAQSTTTRTNDAQGNPLESIKNDSEGFMHHFDSFMLSETRNVGKYTNDFLRSLAGWAVVAVKLTHKNMDSGMTALQGWLQEHSKPVAAGDSRPHSP